MADPVTSGATMNALIHKSVRRDLRRYEAALDRFPAGDRDRAAGIADAFERFDLMLSHHHEGEDRHLWPVLRGTPEDASQVGELTTEHDRIVSALATARDRMRSLRQSASAEDAASAQAAVIEVHAAAEDHFGHEEREMSALLARAEPEALKKAIRQLGRGAGLGESLWFLQWVSDDATEADRAFLRSIIPPPAHWMSRGIAGRKYAAARAAIT